LFGKSAENRFNRADEPMTRTELQAQNPATQVPPGTRGTFVILAAVVLLGFLVQLPRVADFEKFGFYDEGAWLHLDELVAGGAVPGKDVGYSYGMLPLIVSRGWFALFGRSPWAFIAFVLLCNFWTTWGVASIVSEIQNSEFRIQNGSILWRRWGVVALAAIFLSYGIFPNNYSLMHPLEMALIVSALAMQARGRYGGALAFATLAVFTKPTMGYALGLLLLLLAAWLRKGWRIVIAPTITGVAVMLLEITTVGVGPLLSNLLPITGGKSYQQMKFGIFRAGREFWWPPKWDTTSLLNQYVFGPALFWILGSLFVWVAGAIALWQLWQRRPPGGRDRSLLVTIAILHTVFVFALYAWSGSWTYYSYLVVVGILLGLANLQPGRFRTVIAWVFVVVAVPGLKERYGDGFSRWMGMSRPAEAKGLWAYPDFWQEAEKARQMGRDAGSERALWLVHGALGQIWPDVRLPPSWFLSPGIPTESEIRKIHEMIAASDVVILAAFYNPDQELWNWHEFEKEKAAFDVAWSGEKFKVLTRRSK
jgi:hypothetical protein